MSKHKTVQEIVVQFSEALDSATAQSINSYSLATGSEEQEAKEQTGAALQGELQLLGEHGDLADAQDVSAETSA